MMRLREAAGGERPENLLCSNEVFVAQNEPAKTFFHNSSRTMWPYDYLSGIPVGSERHVVVLIEARDRHLRPDSS